MSRDKKLEIIEVGYTPMNLRTLIEVNGFTHKELYEHIGKSRNSFGRYILDVDRDDHVSMSHRDWLKVLEYVGLQKKLYLETDSHILKKK